MLFQRFEAFCAFCLKKLDDSAHCLLSAVSRASSSPRQRLINFLPIFCILLKSHEFRG